MSKFKSVIPVDVLAVKDLLPEGHHLNRIVYDPGQSRVEVHWEHDKFRTKFDFEIEFPIENLKELTVPEGVTVLQPAKAPEKQPEPEFAQRSSQVEAAPANETPTPEKAARVPTQKEKAIAGKKAGK